MEKRIAGITSEAKKRFVEAWKSCANLESQDVDVDALIAEIEEKAFEINVEDVLARKRHSLPQFEMRGLFTKTGHPEILGFEYDDFIFEDADE